MKLQPFLIALFLLAASGVSGQGLRDIFNQQQNLFANSPSPVAMIEMLERQLTDQFKGHAESIAEHTTAKLIAEGQVMARGTLINGRDDKVSYLLCPADAIRTTGYMIQTQDGRLHRPIAGTPIQLLSESDNLALIQLPHLDNVLSFKSNLESSSVGSFVGFLGKDQKWSTGVVTNSLRSAFTGIDPGTQRALSKHWERIGLKVNRKRSGYPEVIETDLNLHPEEAGSPVFDRGGTWHGIAITRADQHSTLLIPAKRVAVLIAEFEITRLK